jgi:hypothetical protein
VIEQAYPPPPPALFLLTGSLGIESLCPLPPSPPSLITNFPPPHPPLLLGVEFYDKDSSPTSLSLSLAALPLMASSFSRTSAM